jgi:hypothetical protein
MSGTSSLIDATLKVFDIPLKDECALSFLLSWKSKEKNSYFYFAIGSKISLSLASSSRRLNGYCTILKSPVSILENS